MTRLSRRDALRLGALVATAPPALALAPTVAGAAVPAGAGAASPAGASAASPAGAAAAPDPAAAGTPASWVAEPFANDRVTLAPSLFTANRDRILTFLRVEKALDDPATQHLAYGPVPLVAQSSATTYREFGFYRDFKLDGDLSRAVRPSGTAMNFTTNGLPVRPFYVNDTAPYHAYFKRSEPTIVFGTTDTGVPNDRREDGLTFLDLVWAGAPFANHGQFVRAVQDISAEWVRAGLLTGPERETVIVGAAQADLRPSR
jgi:hypothetical protein